MISIDGHKEIRHLALIKKMKDRWEESGKTLQAIADEVKIKSPASIHSAFNKKGQVISDGIFTKIANSLGLDVLIVYNEGKRRYYLKTDNDT